MLKLSAADWCFCKPEIDPAKYYRHLKSVGVEGAEMVPAERFPLARAAGLKLLNTIGHSITEGFNRKDLHPGVIAKTREAISLAKKEGIPHIIVFSGNRGQIDDATGKRSCIDGIKQVAGDAERAGVTLLLEVLNSFDHADYHADRSDFAFEVVKAINSPRVRVLYDIYHMHRMGEDTAKTVIANLKWIEHLHVAGSPKRDMIGPDQEIDHTKVVRKIIDAGYRGWWGLEYMPTGDPLEEVKRGAELMRKYAGE
jgi:hydroxypyruvate isomerase